MFKRIDHVEIVPVNTQETIDFYTKVLGFTLQERRKLEGRPPVEEIVFLRLGDTTLEIIGIKNPPPAAKDPYQVGYKRMAIQVDDMDKAVSYLKSKGIEMTREPVKLEKSIRAEFEDPNGLSIELRQW